MSNSDNTFFVLAVNDVKGASNPKLVEIINKNGDFVDDSKLDKKQNVGILISSLEDVQKKYPKLKIERAPAVIINNNKGVVLKTYDIEEGLKFFEDMLKDKD